MFSPVYTLFDPGNVGLDPGKFVRFTHYNVHRTSDEGQGTSDFAQRASQLQELWMKDIELQELWMKDSAQRATNFKNYG